MASFPTSHYLTALTLLILFLETQALNPVSSFSFTNFEKNLKFYQSIALYGNAKVANGGSEVMISRSGGSYGTGKVMCKRPIKLVEGATRQFVSFSTYFSFSGGDGMAFFMVPSGYEGKVFDNSSSWFTLGLKASKGFKAIAVEFGASKGDGNDDSASFDVAINVGDSVSAKKMNASFVNMGLKIGEKMHAWIDYVASSRRLEVRLSQYGHSRPVDPVLWHSIDFSSIWEAKEMFVGFSTVKGNSSKTCFLYSWSFIVRHFPHWMHSEPLDPKILATKNTETPALKPKSDCLLRVLAALIFGVGCGSLTAFIVLYLWTIFGHRRPVMPEEYVMKPVDFEYKKVDIVVDKTIRGAKE